MKKIGVKIADKKDRVLTANLSDILEYIQNGQDYKWSILFIEGVARPEEGKFIKSLADQAKSSLVGYRIAWEELNKLSDLFFQLYEIVLVGDSEEKRVHKYSNDIEMCSNCDATIILIDCSHWEVYLKDEAALIKMHHKFQQTEWIYEPPKS